MTHKFKYIKIFEKYSKNIITVYHGGFIKGKIKPPIYFTDNKYVAKEYGEKLYEFELDISNFLDLTKIEIFQKVKKQIYNNYSELFKRYKNCGGFDGYSKERMLKDYKILSKYKNYNELYNRYLEIIEMDFMQKIFGGDFKGYSGQIDTLYDIDIPKYKNILNEFIVLENQVRNMNKMDDYSLNSFGLYFYDYSLENSYDGYKAWSSDPTGRMKIIEYCLNNPNEIIKIKPYI